MFNPKVLFNALSSSLKNRKIESEIDCELQFHLELLIEEYIASGLSVHEARRAALKRFGDINQVNRICHETRATETRAWLQDLSYAFKTSRANPWYAVLSIFTLCIGITTTIVVFSIANTLLWQPIPYRAPDQLLVVQETNSYGEQVDTSNPNFLDLRDKNTSFKHVTAYSGGVTTISGGEKPERGYVAYVSRDFFAVLGADEPYAGSLLLPEDHSVDALPRVVVSYDFWQRQLGAESNLKDKQLSVAARSFIIAGIMPPGVDYPVEADVWVPRELFNDDSARSAHNLKIIARLKNDINLSQARAEITNISRQLEKEHPQTNAGQSFTAISLHEHLTASARPSLLVLFLGVGLLLFVACANAANLLLIRDSSRRAAIVSRLKLGANRFRIARQLIVESTLLAVVGSLLGLGLSTVMADVILAFVPNKVPGAGEVQIGGEVFCFTLGLAVFAGFMSGVLPALRISQIDSSQSFAEAQPRVKLYSLPTSEIIVTAELALAVILLVGAGMLTQNFWYLSQTDPGFNPESVLTAQISLSSTAYQEVSGKIDFYRQILERIRHSPGIQSAGIINNLPLSGQNINGTFFIEERPEQKHYAGFRIISPDYFQTLAIPLSKGRLFNDRDDENAAAVTIISRNLASQIWAERDPIGQRIRFIGMDQKSDVWMTVIGVVGDVKHSSLNSPAWAEVYVPYSQRPFRSQHMTIVVRTADKPEKAIDSIRFEIHAVDKNLPVLFETMQEVLSKTLAIKRDRSLILILFAFTTITLTLIGFYIIIKHEIARRLCEAMETSDISRPKFIYNSILKGLFLSTAGILAGLIAFYIISRSTKSDIFLEVEVANLGILGAAGIIILILTFLISFVTAYKTDHSNLTVLPIKEDSSFN